MPEGRVSGTSRVLALLVAALLAAAVGGCGSSGAGSGGEGTGGGAEQVSVQLNWFAEPEHGNIFSAVEGGLYEERGIEVEPLNGGPEISSTQVVASGEAEFGIADADEIAQAQAEDIPVVAVAANFQTFPQIFMSHTSANVQGPEDFSGRTIYVAPAANYWDYIKEEYDIQPEREVSYSGSLAPFINNEEAINQAYITSEPYILEEERDVPVDTFLISDLGYNPYVVLYTTERMIQESPETVRSFVGASMQGWDYYYENTESVNRAIGEMNTELSQDLMAYSAETERPLIYTDVTEENGLGYMTEERWSDLVGKLEQTENIEAEVDPSSLYTNEFLPGGGG